jgi:cell division protein FtsW (lipid II flippase)
MQPPMMPSMPRQPPVTMLLALSFLAGLGLLMLAGVLVSATTMSGVVQVDQDNWNAYARMSWNAGFFFLLAAVFGSAVLRKDIDPLGRLFLWLVAFILVLVLFAAPGMFFTRPSP